MGFINNHRQISGSVKGNDSRFCIRGLVHDFSGTQEGRCCQIGGGESANVQGAVVGNVNRSADSAQRVPGAPVRAPGIVANGAATVRERL